jgi:ligand-binding sensor domain-containing protein
MDERSTVYVADLCKVWISRDGERWRMVKDGFDMITDIHILDDTLYLVDYTKGVFEYDGTSWKHLGLSGMGARSLAIDPRDRERIYVATENGFMMSVDSGNSWQEQNRGLTTRDLQVVKVADRIYLGSLLGGFFVSKDGKRWSPENIGLLNTNIHCLAVDWKEPERIYLGTEDGVYKRDGERWRKASDGLVRIAPPPLPKDPEAVRERKRRMGITAPPAEGAHGGGH